MSPAAETPVIVDPNEGLKLMNLHERLVQKFSLPENAHLLKVGQTPEEKAKREFANVLMAFVGIPKPVIIAEGVKLLRVTSFRDPNERRNEPSGSWWFPETLLLGLRAEFEAQLRSQPSDLSGLRRQLQSRLALSDSFSDVEQLWFLELKAGTKLTGLEGPASPQPVDSSLAGSYLNMGNLPGRGWQYYFPNLPADCVVKEYPLRLLEGMRFPKKPIL
jgi:hypothetical protein